MKLPQGATLVVASHNQGKVREIFDLLARFSLRLFELSKLLFLAFGFCLALFEIALQLRKPFFRHRGFLGSGLDALREFVAAGGKRLRPAFCACAFVGAGGSLDDPRVIESYLGKKWAQRALRQVA